MQTSIRLVALAGALAPLVALAAPGPAHVGSATSYEVTFGGGSGAMFSEVTGLRQAQSPAGGAGRTQVHPRRGGVTVTLRGSGNYDAGLLGWLRQGAQHAARQDVTIVLRNAPGEPQITWKLSSCWPEQVQQSSAQAGSARVPKLLVKLGCESLERAA